MQDTRQKGVLAVVIIPWYYVNYVVIRFSNIQGLDDCYDHFFSKLLNILEGGKHFLKFLYD